ncbi:hypothetical protein ACJIZ3_005687 [Penstemon smallii]|uniref:Protein kinase domain-containing protein n=1 Tax=Penstemon smallii TaxID=265156 RepID=A0ABD3S5P1_9LAMI
MGWTRGEILGKGGFAFVSKAKTHQERGHENRPLPPIIAVKSARVSESKPLLKEKELLDQFKACPCILRCYGDDHTTENGQQLYNILLEYASGGCLADRITDKGLPEHVVKHHVKSMLTALGHIHKMGYVHCDVKPHNVLIVKEGTNQDEVAKLADFGSAKKSRPTTEEEQEDGGFRGTVLYAAPESISLQEYLPESDVWALGCTVLHMLTGKAPWKFDKKAQAKDVLFKIGCSNDIPEIPTGKKISEEAKDFVRKCLVKDPRARWRVDMLLDHPFLKMPTVGSRHHHHHLSARFHLMMVLLFMHYNVDDDKFIMSFCRLKKCILL